MLSEECAITTNHLEQDRQPATVEPHLKREFIVFFILFLALIPAFWYAFSRDSDRDLEQDKTQLLIEVDKQLARAKALINQDRLSAAENENALALLLSIKVNDERAEAIQQELNRIAQRYIELLEAALLEQNWKVFEQTLGYASAAAEALGFVGYQDQLKQLEHRATLQQQSVQQHHEDLLQQDPGIYAQFNRFSDTLASGAKGPQMVVIPAGSFTLGSPHTEHGRDQDEAPLREVTIAAFAIGESEITFDDYRLYTEAEKLPLPDDEHWGLGAQPAINVSWLEARNYAIWLSQQTGFHYRLPTEAEWEYAARAGTNTPFAYGDCINNAQANFDARHTLGFEQCPQNTHFFGRPRPVKTLQANPWGLFNIHGNVKEWVQDCWIDQYLPAIVDGSSMTLSEGGGCGIAGGKRVLRGGDWSSSMRTIRSANRYAANERERTATFGFRMAREVDQPQ